MSRNTKYLVLEDGTIIGNHKTLKKAEKTKRWAERSIISQGFKLGKDEVVIYQAIKQPKKDDTDSRRYYLNPPPCSCYLNHSGYTIWDCPKHGRIYND